MPSESSLPQQRSDAAVLLLHGPTAHAAQTCHEALKAEPFWSNLRLDGLMLEPDSTDVLELRRCPQCGSSLAKAVPRRAGHEALYAAFIVVSRSLDALSPRAEGTPAVREGRHA